jgi:hypothetical protein
MVISNRIALTIVLLMGSGAQADEKPKSWLSYHYWFSGKPLNQRESALDKLRKQYHCSFMDRTCLKSSTLFPSILPSSRYRYSDLPRDVRVDKTSNNPTLEDFFRSAAYDVQEGTIKPEALEEIALDDAVKYMQDQEDKIFDSRRSHNEVYGMALEEYARCVGRDQGESEKGSCKHEARWAKMRERDRKNIFNATEPVKRQYEELIPQFQKRKADIEKSRGEWAEFDLIQEGAIPPRSAR